MGFNFKNESSYVWGVIRAMSFDHIIFNSPNNQPRYKGHEMTMDYGGFYFKKRKGKNFFLVCLDPMDLDLDLDLREPKSKSFVWIS